MGIRFRMGRKIAYLTARTAAGAQSLRLGDLFVASRSLGQKFGLQWLRVVGVGREGFVPTIDVTPVGV